MASSPVPELQFEMVTSLAGPSKCSPSVFTPKVRIRQPDTETLPTFESRMWNDGALMTAKFSITMLSRLVRLMPKYHTAVRFPCWAPVVESPSYPFPRLPFKTKLHSETYFPRGGAGGPGLFGIGAAGPL